ncbi:KikA family protein [Pseudomonas sp. S5F11]|nr:KikA family protein [Pseudomonas sp. S5F11]MBX4139604.1 KikA family protein [Pseudomonas sp. S5F11]
MVAGQLRLPERCFPLRLRKSITVVVLAVAVLGTPPAFAADPCKTAFCMFGLLTGTNESQCDDAIKDHFLIIVFKKKKKVDWNQTAKARLGFTNSCPGADPVTNKLINDKFGKVSG